MTDTTQTLARFREIVGAPHVHVGQRATRRFRKGYFYGDGEILAAVRPGTLVEQWRVLEACVAADLIVIFQAANTGLTGGSTPFGDGYDRPIVIINTMRINRIDLIDDGRQVIALPGATLDRLEKRLKPAGREPHSVIGSSCIGASVPGGVCNNSGGSLIRRGPSYTQFALFAQVDAEGRLSLVNHLGIDLGDAPETILSRLDAGTYSEADITYATNRWASDRDYHTHVRDIDADTPARFNADPRRLYDASGSAGRIGVFAVRLDTFAADAGVGVFYIGANDPAELQQIRRDILADFENLPIAGEYIHSEAYETARIYGKDLYLFIRRFGTGKVAGAFAAKSRFDGLTERLGLGATISDKILTWVAKRLPEHLPSRMNTYADRYAHHLALKMGGPGVAEARAYLSARLPNADADFFECTEDEGAAAFLHRFAVGGSVARYRAVHDATVEDIVALDIALPRNATDWFETLPPRITDQIACTVYCGHFFCHVLHQEYLAKKGVDTDALMAEMLAILDTRGAKYPAEHNVGHLYRAAPELEAFYRDLDPTNSFNPGLGRTSRRKMWG